MEKRLNIKLLYLLLSSFTTQLFAGGVEAPAPPPLHHFYVGIGPEAQAYRFTQSQMLTTQTTTVTTPPGRSPVAAANVSSLMTQANFGSINAAGTIVLGARFYIKRFYLAQEFSASYNKSSAVTITNGVLTINDNYALSALLGFNLTPENVSIYARAGACTSNFKYSNGFLSQSWNKYAPGGVFGLGFEIPLLSYAGVRAEYDWTSYGSFSGPTRTAYYGPTTLTSVSSFNNIQESSFRLLFSFYFA